MHRGSSLQATPAAPVVPAASLLLLRDAPRYQVLLGLRPKTARAFPGALVSPGGKLEPQDGDPVWAERLCPDAPEPQAAAVAALRETFEETGVLLARRPDGSPAGCVPEAERVAVELGKLAFAEVLDRRQLRLDGAALAPFSRWVTPAGQPYRFDTCFFLAAAPDPQTPLLRAAEFDALAWWDVDRVLSGAEAGAARLLPPTRSNLLRLGRSRSVAAALAEATAAARRTEAHPGGTAEPI